MSESDKKDVFCSLHAHLLFFNQFWWFWFFLFLVKFSLCGSQQNCYCSCHSHCIKESEWGLCWLKVWKFILSPILIRISVKIPNKIPCLNYFNKSLALSCFEIWGCPDGTNAQGIFYVKSDFHGDFFSEFRIYFFPPLLKQILPFDDFSGQESFSVKLV